MTETIRNIADLRERWREWTFRKEESMPWEKHFGLIRYRATGPGGIHHIEIGSGTRVIAKRLAERLIEAGYEAKEE